MNRVQYFQRLILMLQEIDTEKNDSQSLREVLDYISHEFEKYIDDIK